jgi:hypothetical protein
MGFIMRMRLVLKIVSLAAAVALLMGGSQASARVMKRPPDSCVFHRHVLAAGTICSYACDPKSLWCSQQTCSGGIWSAAIPCQSIFCLRRCG